MRRHVSPRPLPFALTVLAPSQWDPRMNVHVARLSTALGIDSVFELLPTHGTRCERNHMTLTTVDDKLEGAALEEWQAQQMVLYLKARGTNSLRIPLAAHPDRSRRHGEVRRRLVWTCAPEGSALARRLHVR